MTEAIHMYQDSHVSCMAAEISLKLYAKKFHNTVEAH